MPKIYHPETGEVLTVPGNELKDYKLQGYITVGNRPEEEYLGKSRSELAVEWNTAPWDEDLEDEED